jgi:hypothetical protein
MQLPIFHPQISSVSPSWNREKNLLCFSKFSSLRQAIYRPYLRRKCPRAGVRAFTAKDVKKCY